MTGNIYENEKSVISGKNTRGAKKVLILIGTVCGSAILLAAAIFAGYLLFVGEREQIEIEKYVSVFESGVEGQVTLEIYIDEYTLEEDYSYDDAQDALSFLEGITYTYEGEELPISYDSVSSTFNLKKNDIIDIHLEYDNALSKRYHFTADVSVLQHEITDLDTTITDISSIPGEALSQHLADLKEYELAEEDTLLALQFGEHISTFYKIEDTYDPYQSETALDTSGFTLLHAFLYQGRVYLVGETNIVLSYDYLWGDIYYESNLELSEEERKPENIQKAMEARGYQIYQREI